MQIVLTHTTLVIDMPDPCATGQQSTPNRTNGHHAQANSPFAEFADLWSKLQTEMMSGRDSKLWTPPKEIDKNGTPLSQQG